MGKKYLMVVVFVGVLMSAGFVGAAANIENSVSADADTGSAGVKSTMQTQVKVEGSDTLAEDAVNEPDSKMNSLDSKIEAITNRLDAKLDVATENSMKVLPTVNKLEKKDDGEESQRVLPMVNKKAAFQYTQVRGWDPDKKEAILAKVETALENNPKVTSAEVSEENVVVNYSAPGKFLGLFPMNFNLRVSADAQARVKVSFPWHRFLFKTEFAESAELINGVFQHNQTDLEFLKAKESQDRQVEILIKISNTLKIMHDISKPIISNIRA